MHSCRQMSASLEANFYDLSNQGEGGHARTSFEMTKIKLKTEAETGLKLKPKYLFYAVSVYIFV